MNNIRIISKWFSGVSIVFILLTVWFMSRKHFYENNPASQIYEEKSSTFQIIDHIIKEKDATTSIAQSNKTKLNGKYKASKNVKYSLKLLLNGSKSSNRQKDPLVKYLNEDVDILWTKKSIEIPDDVLKFWYTMLGPHTPSGNTKELLSNFFKSGGTSVDPRVNQSGEKIKPYKSCAIVGSSDTILSKKYGAEIDDNESVFRFNNAPIKGYEKYVGSKTTHRVIYPESAKGDINYKDIVLILVPFKINDLKWITSATTNGAYVMKSWAPVPKHIQTTPSKVWIVSPSLIKNIQSKFLPNNNKKYPSTGMIGAMLGMRLCENVSVYGFGPNKYGEWGHYYQNQKIKASSTNHNSTGEINLFKKLDKLNLLRFFGE